MTPTSGGGDGCGAAPGLKSRAIASELNATVVASAAAPLSKARRSTLSDPSVLWGTVNRLDIIASHVFCWKTIMVEHSGKSWGTTGDSVRETALDDALFFENRSPVGLKTLWLRSDPR